LICMEGLRPIVDLTRLEAHIGGSRNALIRIEGLRRIPVTLDDDLVAESELT